MGRRVMPPLHILENNILYSDLALVPVMPVPVLEPVVNTFVFLIFKPRVIKRIAGDHLIRRFSVGNDLLIPNAN